MDDSLRALERQAAQGDPLAKERLERERARAGLPETTAEVLGALEAVEARLAAAEEAFEAEGAATFRSWVDAVFAAEPGLGVAVVRGYTPGFMDGELCEHQQSALLSDEDDELGDLFAPDGEPLNTLPQARRNQLEAELGEFAPLLEALHDTNWQLVLRRADEGVARELSAYDCEY